MAKTDLAKLVVSLEAQNTQMLQKLEQSEKRALAWQRKVEKNVAKVGSAFKGLLVGGAAVAGFSAVVRATMESEKAIAQLESALKSTGGAVGFTSEQMQDFASTLQKTSTYGDEAIIELQTRLLSFGNVTGDVFKRATQATLDLSTRLGKDLNSSALQVGKALNDPIKGLAGLSRAGIQFSADQKEVIKSLAETGHLAEAQTIILDALEQKFGGAAEAARNTFGGALQALGEAFGDLLESKGGMGDATKSLNEFTDLLQDPSTVQAANTLTSSLVTGFSLVTEALVGSFNALSTFGEKLRNSRTFIEAVDYIGNWAKETRENVEGAFTGIPPNTTGTITKADRDAAWGRGAPAGPMPGNAPRGINGGGGGAGKEKEPQRKSMAYVNALTRESDTLLEQAEETARKIEDRMDATNRYKIAQTEACMASSEAMLAEFESTQTEMSEFAKAAAQNMQSAFADFLFDPFSGSLKEMALDFVNVLRRMAAEAVAAKIFEKLLGAGGAASGGGGWIGALFSSFAGAKDSGGIIPSGKWGIAGEKGPEIISGPANVMSRMDTSRAFGASGNDGRGDTKIRLISITDSQNVSDYLSSDPGEQNILAIADKNRAFFKQLVAG